MAKKPQPTPEEVTELFSELDSSGVVDPARVKARKRRHVPQRSKRSLANEGAVPSEGAGSRADDAPRAGELVDGFAADEEGAGKKALLPEEDGRSRREATVDPLSDEDPSGSKVGNTISRFGVAFIVGIIALVVGLQIGYGVMRRLNTANLSDTVNAETVARALEGGVEWGNGFTQFPDEFTIDEADESTGVVEVSVVSTDAENELELFSNSQIEAAALATNALLNDNINRVVYNVSAVVDDDGNIVSEGFLSGDVLDRGEVQQIFSFIWTKNKSEASSNIDWQLRIVGMDEEIAAQIQEQVNSVSSLIGTPSVDEADLEAQDEERSFGQALKGEELYLGTDGGETLSDALSAATQGDGDDDDEATDSSGAADAGADASSDAADEASEAS